MCYGTYMCAEPRTDADATGVVHLSVFSVRLKTNFARL